MSTESVTLEQGIRGTRDFLAGRDVDSRFRQMRIAVLEEDASASVEGAAERLADEMDEVRAEDDLELALRSSERPNRTVSATTRYQIMERDGGVCQLCGTLEGPWEVDHKHPHSRGGADHPSNLWLLCKPCNRYKCALTVEEYRELLTSQDLDMLA